MTIAQRLAKIPQMWIAGFTRNGATVLQAIEHWEQQERLSSTMSDADDFEEIDRIQGRIN